MRAELNARPDRIGAKIRDAQLQKIPLMLGVGTREAEAGTVAVRERSRGNVGAVPLEQFEQVILGLIRSRAPSTSFPAAVSNCRH